MATGRCVHGCLVTAPDRAGVRPWQPTADALQEHYRTEHDGLAATTVTQLDSVTWQEQYLNVIRALPVGTEYTTAELHGRLPDPPHPNHWGAAQGVAAHLGLAQMVTTQKSELPTTKGSRLCRWQRVDEAAQRRVAS